jgi:glycerol uptake facilitator protein
MSVGANAGYAINPARDVSPRFFAWLAGWDTVALPGVHGLWVPIIGPLIGGVIGAVVYDFFIRDVLRARGAPPAPDVAARGETVEEEPTGSRPRGPGGRAGRRRYTQASGRTVRDP